MKTLREIKMEYKSATGYDKTVANGNDLFCVASEKEKIIDAVKAINNKFVILDRKFFDYLLFRIK